MKAIKRLIGMQALIRAVTGEPFYLVGGCVRDALFGKEPKDYDAVICLSEGGDYADAFATIERFAIAFRQTGASVKVYQSYGINIGQEVNPTSFQAMFYSCLKVEYEHCGIDILLSKANTVDEHVARHDCNANMVYLGDDDTIKWVHGGDKPLVAELVFNKDVCEERRIYMTEKWLNLI